ncbi:hypothetical protein FMO003_27150 [Moritella sp. F3]|nr:hypothetical protein FMO001_26040 [Moritella sp. F1]GIC82434.1 hypothetical protein FMO003_27150 [Moritella sp. F3]
MTKSKLFHYVFNTLILKVITRYQANNFQINAFPPPFIGTKNQITSYFKHIYLLFILSLYNAGLYNSRYAIVI